MHPIQNPRFRRPLRLTDQPTLQAEAQEEGAEHRDHWLIFRYLWPCSTGFELYIKRGRGVIVFSSWLSCASVP